MSFGIFLLGLIMMAIGFMAVWKTNWFLQNFGDISELFGSGQQWLSWKAVGLFFMFLGFLVAFGLIQAFFGATIGGLFGFGKVN
jgi:hypothetical protein